MRIGASTPLTLLLHNVEGATRLRGRLDFAKVSEGALAFMDKTERENMAAIAADGVGLRYGEKSSFGLMNRAQRFAYVQNVVRAKDPTRAEDARYIDALIQRMKPTSCIGYTLQCLAAGYAAAGQSARWNEIRAAVAAKGTIGTVLMNELQKDGWQAHYWNADTATYRGPRETAKDVQRMKDHHLFAARFVGAGGVFKRGGDYYGTIPQGALLNFFAAPAGLAPSVDRAPLRALERVPFWVGIAASGYHTFPGARMNVRDSHVSRNPDDATNIENRPFEELAYAWDSAQRRRKTTPSGAPVYSEELSGLLLMPPAAQ